MATQVQAVRSDVIKAVAQRLLPVLEGERKVVAECALLLAYCCIADGGAAAFSSETIEARISLFLTRGSDSLCEILEDVSRMDDSDLEIGPPKSQLVN